MAVVTVVGAGPVGLQTAIVVRQNGFDVEVLEEHKEVGLPVACTGLIQKKSCEELGLDLSDSKVNEIRGARIFSPSNHVLEVRRNETVANVVNRHLFDKSFLKKAEKLGIPVQVDTKLIDVSKNSLFIEARGRGELRKTSIVVGADGAHSVVRNIVQPGIGNNLFIHAIQVTAKGSFDKDMVELHFGKFAPNFFVWVAPESSEWARVGLGAPLGSNLKKLLKEFAVERGIELHDSCDRLSGLIPVGAPLKSCVKDNMLLVGDAGFITKATTGGGLMLGLKSANLCAEAIVAHLKDKKPLSGYDSKLKPITRDLMIHWKIYSFIHSLKPEQIDSYFLKAKKAGVEDFLSKHGDMDHPSRFVGKILTQPRLWGMMGAALKVIL